MHITLESDYAVRIVHCLARKRERMDAKRIAEEPGAPPPYPLHTLRKPATGGRVHPSTATPGRNELARDPGEISLCDVIEMVEGPYSLARCLRETDYHCSRNVETCEVCKFQQVYAEISETVREKLSAVKFSNT